MAEGQATALAGIRTKLNRANSQLDRLYLEMNAYNDSEPFTLGDPQPTADHSQWIYPLLFRRPMPLVWAVVLGEVIHNLRSALDHTIFQLTYDYFGQELEATGFPILQAASWDSRKPKHVAADNPAGYSPGCAMYQIRGVGSGVVEYIKRLQPYSSQQPQASALVALQLLSNQDKHRLIHFWGLQLVEKGTDLRIEGGDRAHSIKLATGVLHHGDVAITTTADGPSVKGQLNGRLKTNVAFENPADPTPGVNDRLWRLYDATAGIVGTLLAAIGRQDESIP